MQDDKQKPKILFLAQLPPPVHGASQRNLSVAESEIINENFDLIILPLSFSKTIKELGKTSFKKFFLFLSFVFRLIKLLFQNKFSFAYYTISVRPLGITRDAIIIFILRLFNVKLLYHLRNKGVKVYSKNKFLKIIYKWVFKNSSVICLSKSISLDIIDFINDSQLYIVPNGIKVSEVKVEEKAETQSLNFIYLSHLRKSKGIMEFLEALKKLSDKGYQVSATVVGDEGDIGFDVINDFCKSHKIEDKVDVKGPLYGNQKFEALNNADIFVFPTYYYNEIFPGVILEAMQMKLPIITTNEGAISDMIQDRKNGLIVDKQSIESLEKAMTELAENKALRQQISKQAYEDFYNYFTMEVFETNMLEVYKTINDKNSAL
ncbi:glycosyltransferase family 4 protein [Winogradskyella tangerina]|uniref:glycosyltransferase family 4 protein n=1 Tax=Winogradskyella tangerina TaxID=2023240 RepID=UPI000DBE9D3B|nr:glycosyltransferase family 4 protein [Winogradskyella tangerina]